MTANIGSVKHVDKGAIAMTVIRLTIEVESGTDNAELISWMTRMLSNSDNPIVQVKNRKQREPMTAEEKIVLNARFAQGRIDAAVERGEEPKERDLAFIEAAQNLDAGTAPVDGDNGADTEEPVDKVAAAEARGRALKKKAPAKKKAAPKAKAKA